MPLYNPIELSDPILTWVTGTSYGVGDDVVDSSKLYSCLIAHTSGTFATDLGASKWGEIGAGVTSVGTAGTINGLTLTGTVTSTGNLTLGGTLAINDGDWSGTDLSPANGGTGLSSYSTGDLLYASGSTTLSKLAVGSNTEVLTLAGGVPTWAAAGGGGASTLDELTDVKSTSDNSIWIMNAGHGSACTTGTLSSALDNIGIGTNALNSITSGDYNIAIGLNAGTALLGALHNVMIGRGSGAKLTSGSSNVCIGGYDAGGELTTELNNTLMGYQAGGALTSADNTIIGHLAGTGAMSGSGANTFVGKSAGTTCTGAGQQNSAFGYSAEAGTTGWYNVSIGRGVAGTTGSGNIKIGNNWSKTNHTTGSYSIKIGAEIAATAGASYEFLLGGSARILMNGDYTTAGQAKLLINPGAAIVAPGATLHVKGYGTSTDVSFLIDDGGDVEVFKVLADGTARINNAYNLPTAVTGSNDYVLTAQTDGSTAWASAGGGGGASAIDGLSDGATNATSVFLGHVPTNEGTNNTAVGIGALDSLPSSSTGDMNTAIGNLSGTALTTGAENTFIGWNSGCLIETGGFNTCIGEQTKGAAGTAYSTFLGSMAGNGKAGLSNVYIGFAAGYSAGGTTSNYTVGIGVNALQDETTGYNVGIGANAFVNMTGGQQNIGMGSYQCGHTLLTGLGNAILGCRNDGIAAGSYQLVLGYHISATQSSSLVVGTNTKILLHGEFATSGATKLGINLGTTFQVPSATLHVKGGGATSGTTSLLIENSSGTDHVEVKDDGTVFMYNLPTSDPSVTGQLWNDSGTLKVSA